MNKNQIKYLDGRITAEAKAIRARLDHDFSEKKEKLFNKLSLKEDDEYLKKLESLSKDQLVARMLQLFHDSRDMYYDGRNYTVMDNFSGLDTSLYLKRRNLFDFDNFLSRFGETAVQEFSVLYKDYNESVGRLQTEVDHLRDRINLGEASDAIESLDAFIDRWNKIIFSAESDDSAENVKKTKKRK